MSKSVCECCGYVDTTGKLDTCPMCGEASWMRSSASLGESPLDQRPKTSTPKKKVSKKKASKKGS